MDTEKVEVIRKYIQENERSYSQRGMHQMLREAGYKEEDIREAFRLEEIAKKLEFRWGEKPIDNGLQVVLALLFLFAVIFMCLSTSGGGCRVG